MDILKISFNNIDAQTSRCCYILGFENAICSDISFNNSKLEYIPESSDNNRAPCDYWDIKDHVKNKYDCAFYIDKAENIIFNNFIIDKKDYLKNTTIIENVTNFVEI